MTKIILPTLIFNEPLSIEQQVTRIKEYGADGIEVRRERLKELSSELEIFKRSIKASDLDPVIYSVPIELWLDAGSLNPMAITAMKEAELLQATHIKFSLGKFHANHANADRFADWIETALPKGMKLLIENDQSPYGGGLQSIRSFFQWMERAPVGMTFDVGNWTVNGENWREAYHSLHQWIEYLHLKLVKKSKEGWESIPVANEHLEIPFPSYTAIEFPLANADIEAPEWIKKLKD